jgi:hypothetical protein
VIGQTESTKFPLVYPAQSTYSGGDNDAFATKLNTPNRVTRYTYDGLLRLIGAPGGQVGPTNSDPVAEGLAEMIPSTSSSPANRAIIATFLPILPRVPARNLSENQHGPHVGMR